MTLTPEQWADMRADIIKAAAAGVVESYCQDILAEIGAYLGKKTAIPLSLAVRISPWNEKWIRRNLPIIKAEGQVDSIELGDLTTAMENRKNKPSLVPREHRTTPAERG
jgi:hypothetical protein